MGHQIIKQPNGRYAIFSSIPDHIIMYDATPEDIIEFYVDQERQRFTEGIQQTIAELEAGGKPYYQFTMTWDEVIEKIKRLHGADDKDLKDIVNAASIPFDGEAG